jgi:hypothetical protein
MNESFNTYYIAFHKKYYNKIMNIIEHYYPKENFHKIKSKNKFIVYNKIRSLSSSYLSTFRSKTKSKSKEKEKSKKNINFEYFLYSYVARLILIFELKTFIPNQLTWIPHISDMQKHLHNISYIKPLSNYYGNENTNYFQINPTTMIKIVNISDQEIINRNVEISVFYQEVEIAKIAHKIGVGPKIIDVQIFVDSTNCKSYGVLYIEYIDGINIKDYLEENNHQHKNKEEVQEVRKKLENLFIKLYQHNITLMSPHRKDIPCNIILVKEKDIKRSKIVIMDYTFAQYISAYVYQRNHERISNFYLFTRKDIYNTLYNYILHLYKKS